MPAPRTLLGAALLAAGLLLGVALHLLAPLPPSFYAVREEVEARGTLPAREARFVTSDFILHSYDAASDRTAFFVAYCNHSLCGPVVWLAGDHRAAPPAGAALLAPRGDVTTEPFNATADPGPRPVQNDGHERRALSAVYDVRPVAPLLWGYAGALALLLTAAAFLAPGLPWRASLVAAGVALLAVLLGAQARGAWVILVGMASLLLAPAALALLVTAGVAAARRNARTLAWSLAAGLAALGLVAAGFLAGHLHPPAGGGI